MNAKSQQQYTVQTNDNQYLCIRGDGYIYLVEDLAAAHRFNSAIQAIKVASDAGFDLTQLHLHLL